MRVLGKYNLLLITVDCLRADYLYHCKRNVTQNLNKLSDRALSFTNATAPSYSTLPSFISIFSKTFPSEAHGVLLLNLRGSLMKLIKNAGYQTIAIHNNPFISRLYGFHEGFDYFYDDLITSKIVGEKSYLLKIRSFLKRKVKFKFLEGMLQKIYRKISIYKYEKYNLQADEINNIFFVWLKRCKDKNKPFFAWLHYMDLHAPYFPPLDYLPSHLSKEEVIRLNLMKDQELFHVKDKLIELYCISLNYLDDALGRLLDGLKELNEFDKTYIIITADHGHGFWEHGILGHLSSCLYEELLHVPLMIIGPNLKPQRVESPISLYSLFDIIYELLGLKSKSLILDGRFNEEKYVSIYDVISEGGYISLLESRISKPCFKLSELAIKLKYRNHIYKYIFRLNGQHELYDLTNDPLERRNIVNNKIEVANLCYMKILKHLNRVKSRNKLRYRITKVRRELTYVSHG